jgi:hypothetical protein
MTDERVAEIMKIIYEPAYVDVNVRDDVSELVTALTDAIGSEHEELEAERAKVARVRELHRPTPNIAECGIERGCTKCRSEWPCETILALDGEVMNDGRTEQGGKWTYERPVCDRCPVCEGHHRDYICSDEE